ncbi:MAG TPA: hypothetical protein VF519_17205 [Mycobacteriales bacterium]|jgi:hypothetical protein
MDRSSLARRIAPVAVFGAVLGGIVLVNETGGGGPARRAPRPLPLSAAGSARDSAAESRQPRPAFGYGWAETHIADSLLAGLPTEGPAYELRPVPDRVAALAKALGVEGEVRRGPEGWVVGTDRWALTVMDSSGQPWYLATPKVAVDGGGGSSGSTGSVGVATAEPARDTPLAEPSPAPPEKPSGAPADEPVPPPPAPAPEMPTMPPQPSDAAARAVLDRVLAVLGLDEVAVTMTPGYDGKEAVAAPVVGGLPTYGWDVRVTVKADGTLSYANGYLATPALDATYPLLGAREAVARNGIGYARDTGMRGGPAVGAPNGAEPALAPSPSPVVREATRVRLGLMLMWSWDRTKPSYLTPAWLVTTDGYEAGYLALPDEYVATPPPPDPGEKPDEPVCDPSPCPTRDAPPPPDATGGGGDPDTGSGSVPGSTGAPE